MNRKDEVDEQRSGLENGIQAAALLAVLRGAVDCYVKQRSRDTVLNNAIEDPAKPQAQRVVEPDACDHCKILGNSLPVDPRKVANWYHQYCKCQVMLVFRRAARKIDSAFPARYAKKREELLSNERFFAEHKTVVGAVGIGRNQFGRKSKTHMKDYGLNPANPADRSIFRETILDGLYIPDTLLEGSWRDSNEYDAYFFVRNGDAIIVKKETMEYVSILRGGANANKRVQSARFVLGRERRNP